MRSSGRRCRQPTHPEIHPEVGPVLLPDAERAQPFQVEPVVFLLAHSRSDRPRDRLRFLLRSLRAQRSLGFPAPHQFRRASDMSSVLTILYLLNTEPGLDLGVDGLERLLEFVLQVGLDLRQFFSALPGQLPSVVLLNGRAVPFPISTPGEEQGGSGMTSRLVVDGLWRTRLPGPRPRSKETQSADELFTQRRPESGSPRPCGAGRLP